MRPLSSRLRAALAAGVVGVTGAAGLAALTMPVHADATFTFTRLAGSDRFATAGAIDQAAYPSGATGASVLLADGLTAHAPDALAASGLEGVDHVGVLLTDDTNTVPSSTLSALSANKVKDIGVLGGTASVSQDQINQLKADGYTVVTPYQGSTRYQTMKLIDETITPSQVGTDAAGNPTAILASGDPAHFVDALSAGALAYAKKFPIILTNSTTPGLEPEAQQVIQYLGIKDLIVVGGTSSVPASQYSPAPTGISQVEVEYGSDRSATSVALAKYAIGQGWLSDAHMDLARGDDGADALAGSAFGGVNAYPTVITDSTTADGSAPDFATEYASTLTGTSYIFGGTDAVTTTQQTDVANAAGASKAATAGAISPSSGQQVNSVNATTFTQGGLAYTYGSGDTYQIDTTTAPSPTASCTATTYAVFQASITQGDTVSGTYAPGATSTFCLDDIAPRPPSSVTAASSPSAGGISLTWSAPSTQVGDGVTQYDVYRATATAGTLPGTPDTCPAAYTTAPGSSPQAPPAAANGYSMVGSVPVSSETPTGSFSYSDTTATPGTGSTPNQYCYAVSAVAVAGSGASQVGSAEPANNTNPLTSSDPGPVGPAGGMAITSVSGQGHTITVTYNQAVNSATVASNGSDYVLTGVTFSPASAPTTKQAYVSSTASNEVILDVDFGTVGSSFTVAQQSGSDGNTVCASGGTTNCAATSTTPVTGTGTPATTAPTITGVSGSFTGSTITITYNEAIDCATVDTTGAQYQVTQGSSAVTPMSASCGTSSGGTAPVTAKTVTLSFTPLTLTSGSTIKVTYNPLLVPTGKAAPASTDGIVCSATGGGESVPDPSGGGSYSGAVGT